MDMRFVCIECGQYIDDGGTMIHGCCSEECYKENIKDTDEK